MAMGKTFEGNLALMTELLQCGTDIALWHYGVDGHLVASTSDHLVLDKIFEHSGNKAYMLEQLGKYTAPLILGGKLGLMWCAIFAYQEDGTPKAIHVLGPVFNAEISNAAIEKSVSDYRIDPTWRQGYTELMASLPVVSSLLFFQYALMTHYCVTGEKLNRSDLHFRKWTPEEHKGRGVDTEPQRNRMQVWLAEQNLLHMVREGNMDYKKAMSRAGLMSSGVKAGGKHPLMQAIVSCTCFTSLCVREAIQAGLSPDTAYSVGDSYIQSMLNCQTVTELWSVNHDMYEDFIQRVHKIKAKPGVSVQIRTCRDYIERHPEEDLSLPMLARQVGYSEYHLSRKFKEEMGITLSAYIRSVRVEKAKQKLLWSKDSISKIALDLRFSSGSHFASAFEAATGQNPQQYRQENQQVVLTEEME